MINKRSFYALREEVTADESTPAIGTGINLKGSEKCKVEVILEGTDPGATIQMLQGDANGEAYVRTGDAVSVSSNEKFLYECGGNKDVNCQITNISGTGTKVSVRIIT